MQKSLIGSSLDSKLFSARSLRRFFHISPWSVILPVLLVFASVFAVSSAEAREFKKALPGYHFEFPRDHASHDSFKTEWWYYTGHLATKQGRRFGYELTFFRSGVENPPKAVPSSPWQMDNVFLAHFAVTDIEKGKFVNFERMNRAGLNVAGARQDACLVFNETWSAARLGDKFTLEADSDGYSIKLLLTPAKPPVVHGKDGVSQKASCAGCASHYYSLTRLKTEGVIVLEDGAHEVTGESWMDHEFGSNQLSEDQEGWDWFSIQLSDGSELMLYNMRRRNGGVDKHSSGTIIGADGSSRHLPVSAMSIKPVATWKSPTTGAIYPSGWKVSIPDSGITLELAPVQKDQELVTSGSTGITYWEGAVDVKGVKGGKKVSGRGYVELVGYAEKFKKRI